MKTKKEQIEDRINELQVFLECDLYTKFDPRITIEGRKFQRKDYFKDEKEFIEYLRSHFKILKRQIRRII
jgi:hypothetical protein